MREPNSPQGRLLITLRDPSTDRIVATRRVDNLVTLAGRTLLSAMLTGAISGFATMELVVGGPSDPDDPGDGGANPPPPALGDVALYNQLQAIPVVVDKTESRDDGSGNERIFTLISGTLEAVAGGDKLAMTEAGIQITKLDNATVLYNRVTFDRITKEANLEMTLTWEVIF